MNNNALPQHKDYEFEVICNYGCNLSKKVRVLAADCGASSNTRLDHSDKYGDICSE